MGRLISVLAVLLTCGAIALSADLFRMAGLSLYSEQYLAGLLAIATPLVFLNFSARGERDRTAGEHDRQYADEPPHGATLATAAGLRNPNTSSPPAPRRKELMAAAAAWHSTRSQEDSWD